MKKKNSKLHSSNKPKYISKADREKMADEDQQTTTEDQLVTDAE